MADNRLTPHRLLCLSLALLPVAQASASADSQAVAIGRDIYELASGQSPITVQFEGGDWVPAAPVHACRSCHGDSGEGASEGTIEAPALHPLIANAGDRWAAWLDDALLRHQAPGGRPLNAGMPRYRLSASDRAMLGAYLRALPQAEVPGVDANAITVGVSFAHSGLSPAGEQTLISQLDQLAISVNAEGGIYGRRLLFNTSAQRTAALADLTWNGDSTTTAPTLTVQPPAAAQAAGLFCGSLDPPETFRTRAVLDWLERQGLPAVMADDGSEMKGKAVVVPHGYDAPSQTLAAANMVYTQATMAARLSALMPSTQLRIYAAGDMTKRAEAARSLIQANAVDPRDAMRISAYLEGGALIVSALKNSGRRIRRMSFCDTLRGLSRAQQSVSIIVGDTVTVIPAG